MTLHIREHVSNLDLQSIIDLASSCSYLLVEFKEVAILEKILIKYSCGKTTIGLEMLKLGGPLSLYFNLQLQYILIYTDICFPFFDLKKI